MKAGGNLHLHLSRQNAPIYHPANYGHTLPTDFTMVFVRPPPWPSDIAPQLGNS